MSTTDFNTTNNKTLDDTHYSLKEVSSYDGERLLLLSPLYTTASYSYASANGYTVHNKNLFWDLWYEWNFLLENYDLDCKQVSADFTAEDKALKKSRIVKQTKGVPSGVPSTSRYYRLDHPVARKWWEFVKYRFSR